MSKHTPGPWYVSKRNPLRVIESGPRAITLATCSTLGRGVTAENAQTEAEANARLIAAAPELCEALRNLLAVHEGEGGTLPNATGMARAALAKVDA